MVDTAFFKNNGPFALKQIAQICEATLINADKGDVKVFDIAPMTDAKEGEICFFYDRKAKAKAAEMKATACVTTPDLAEFVPENVIVLTAQNPKIAYLKLNQAFYEAYQQAPYISEKASIHPSAKIGKNCSIGDFVTVCENAVIGDGCQLENGCYIGRGCEIGQNTRIGVNAYVSYCKMGSHCYIYTGARIGADGFGFDMIAGRHVRIPQVGRVIIGDDVEIGANACVDRGALADTVIGDGCRIDNLVQVAHNDKLGQGCILVAQTGIAGSCTFGDYVVCGGQTGFADHLNIGSGVQVGAQSGVMRDIEPGAVVMGSPTVPFKDFMRQVAFLQKNSKKS